MIERNSRQHQHELETLRLLLRLPPEVLGGFSPRRPPEQVTRYITSAPKPELDWILVDVLHQLRLRAHEGERQRTSHGRW